MIVLTMNSVSAAVRFGSRARTSWPRTRKNGGLSTSKWMSETFFSKAIPRIWSSRFMSMVLPLGSPAVEDALERQPGLRRDRLDELEVDGGRLALAEVRVRHRNRRARRA